LAIEKGKIHAKVSGSSLYTVDIKIKPLATKKWDAIKSRCSGQIGSLLELLQGRLSDQVMSVVTDRSEGLFPQPGEISFDCSCPDWASMCKHVAAVLYGVGARLDSKPALLFLLRGVDHEELISADAEATISDVTARGTSKRLAGDNIGDIFGIDLDPALDAEKPKAKLKKKTAKQPKSKNKVVKKKSAKKKKTVKKKTAKKKSAKAKPNRT
jgi:uncharacterized Zn finger protein